MHDRLATLAGAVSDNEPGSDARRNALLEVARLIEAIRIHPLPGRGKIEIELTPRLDALVGLAMDADWSFDPSAPEPAP